MSGSGGGGGGSFGGGGGFANFDCGKISIKTNVTSPDPSVLAKVSEGDNLQVSLQNATGPLMAVTIAGDILGAIFTKDPTSLISCINGGYRYKAAILSINGGSVEILIINR